jgi:hypothetical protein
VNLPALLQQHDRRCGELLRHRTDPEFSLGLIGYVELDIRKSISLMQDRLPRPSHHDYATEPAGVGFRAEVCIETLLGGLRQSDSDAREQN